MEMEQITRWVYILFVVIAIIMGLAVGYMAYNGDPNTANLAGWVTLVMLILGIISGLTSITVKEVTPFLIASIALMVAGTGTGVWEPLINISDLLFWWATYILNFIIAFAAPAAVLIAIKSLLIMVKEK
jgi:hypothetical protein